MKKFKLSLMMGLQYMMFAVWWVPLAAYLTNLEVSSVQKALILSSMAIGCMASPLVGMLADRFFAAQKVLAGMNFIHAVMLLWAAVTPQSCCPCHKIWFRHRFLSMIYN